eukprot:830140-Karenia_brevis.AAC.1
MEPWHEWAKRTTRECEHRLECLAIEDWITQWRRQQWRWARKLVTSDKHKWSYAALNWQPANNTTRAVSRKPARPHKRWDDDLRQFLAQHTQHYDEDWQKLATTATWEQLEDEHIDNFRL